MEFNIWCDPEAADVVFSSGVPNEMVGPNATRPVAPTPERRAQIRAIGSRTGGIVVDMLDFYSARSRVLSGLLGGSMHDRLALASPVDSEVLRFGPMHVAVEPRGTHTYGMTVRGARHLPPDSPSPVAAGLPRGTRQTPRLRHR